MKIHGSDGISPLQPAERHSSTATPAQGAFEAVLKETLSPAPAASAPGAAVAIPFRPPIQSIDGSAEAVDRRLERFIDLLDDYRGKLADGRVNLRELDPVVRSIEQARGALEPVLAGLPEADGLKEILNRALVTAESEIARYRRGDYLPA